MDCQYFIMMKRLIIILGLVLVWSGTFAASAPRKSRPKAVSIEELFSKADEAVMMYDTDALQEAIDGITEHLERNKKATEADHERLKTLQNRAIALSNMLGRVEQIAVLDSLTVDFADLSANILLSHDAGVIGGDGELTTFSPAAGREVFFTEKDSTGRRHIMYAGILDDGTREKAVPLRLFEDESVETAYPFMMADGSTLYFAANADTDNSLGGMDIYMTRRDEQGNFYEPTNVGMPYNSPFNDFMMAFDETSGLGYWATDRNAPDGMVTVFVFKPNDTRVNYDADREDLPDLAFVSSVSATRPESMDAAAILRNAREAAASSATSDNGTPFRFSLGNGTVYTSPSQFHSSRARDLVNRYIDEGKKIDALEKRLAQMRNTLVEGGTVGRGKILSAEKELTALRRTHQNTANAIIRAETR